MARSLTEVQTWLDRRKGEAGMIIEEFKDRLGRHPTTAMSHSLAAFQASSMLALTAFYEVFITSALGKEATREDTVRQVRQTVEKEILEISLNAASSPFMGTAELSRRCYLEALASLKEFLGEAAPQPLKPSPSLTPHSSVKELEIAASALPIRLEQPPDYREALEDLDNAQGRWIKARIDYPYSDIDIDQAKEDYKDAIKKEDARKWG